jgi:hypothetical protein
MNIHCAFVKAGTRSGLRFIRTEFHLQLEKAATNTVGPLQMTVRHSWRNSQRRGAFIADFQLINERLQ